MWTLFFSCLISRLFWNRLPSNNKKSPLFGLNYSHLTTHMIHITTTHDISLGKVIEDNGKPRHNDIESLRLNNTLFQFQRLGSWKIKFLTNLTFQLLFQHLIENSTKFTYQWKACLWCKKHSLEEKLCRWHRTFMPRRLSKQKIDEYSRMYDICIINWTLNHHKHSNMKMHIYLLTNDEHSVHTPLLVYNTDWRLLASLSLLYYNCSACNEGFMGQTPMTSLEHSV